MKKQFTWFGVLAAIIIGISTFFVGCNKDDLNEVVAYKGQVVYINTTIPFADLTVKVTNGKDTHCQTQTDAGGFFSLKVRVNEIDGDYYLLAGDSTCIPKKVGLGGYGQAEVDLGVIEVEGPALPTVITTPLQSVKADEAVLGGEVLTDGRMRVTARGICYGKDPYPVIEGLHTTEGSGLGAFTSTLKNLEFNTIYYARAYATNQKGTAYGDQVKFTTEEGVAIVITDTIINITAHSAKCKGHVESDGGFPVVKRGTCWSKRPDPTVDDDCSDDGSGKGEFTSTLKDLLENTTYYVRTYATNSTKTTYGEQKIITTLDGLAVVQTDSIPISSITATGFTAYGTVVSDCDIPVTARGFCYSTKQYPTIEEDKYTTINKGLGSYRSTISGLEYATTYYVRAYATNETGTVYSEQEEVTTLTGLPIVTTDEVTNIGSVKATCGGEVTDDGSLTVTARGVCYGTAQQPTIEDAHTTDGKGKGKFTSSLKNLQDKTTYYVRAYATTDAGTAYGEQRTFKTENGIPVVVLSQVGEPTANSVSCTGNVTGDGGVTVTERGFCYSVSQYPTNTDAHIAIGNGMGEFMGSLTGLNVNTTYYVRAYALNSIGVGYSEQQAFTTKNGLATVTTAEATSTATSITTGGNVIDNGGYAVTERGVCYSTTNEQPTITDEKVLGGSGNGAYNVSITGLSANTTYYIRAYATNVNGIAYGEAISIQTKSGNASVIIAEATNITALTATSTVTVTDAGSATLQSCGICWSTNPTPTISDSKTAATGKALNTAYPCNMSELQPGTTYYVRGYATTDVATTYSEQKSFTTKTGAAEVTLGAITNITALTASASVTISEANGASLQSCGICWSTNPTPTIIDNKSIATGKVLNTAYICNISELQPNTTYYVRAFATTDITTSYSTTKSFTTITGLPVVSTGIASSTATSFTCAGEVTSDAGYAVSERGICYSKTNAEPTILDTKVTSGSGKGTFNITVSELSPMLSYYIRAYATNSNGTAYGDVVSITTKSGSATVTTGAITNIKALTATGSVYVSDAGGASLQSCGICWSTNPNPTIGHNKVTGGNQINTTYSCNLSSLTPNTTYYVRAYATTNISTMYGEEISFKTTTGLATLSTKTPSATSTTITSGGNISNDGGYTITERGICYSTTNANPSIQDGVVSNGKGTGDYSCSVSNAKVSTTYYLRAYAKNEVGVAYGSSVSIVTNNGLATVQTTSVTNIRANSVQTGGSVACDNDVTILDRGMCWSTQIDNPTISDSKKSEGAGIGTFISSINNLNASTKYYIRAYATTKYGTTYGNSISATTTSGLPTVTISPLNYKSATTSSISVNGEIISEGDASITACGFCWSTSGVPTIANAHSTQSGGIGKYNFTITGVTPLNSMYYIRAYATNAYGTSYSDVIIHDVANPHNLPVVSVSGNRYMIYPEDLGTYTLAGGKEACNNLNQYGYNDWRMPSISEMSSITDYGGILYFTENVNYWTTSFVQDVYTGIVKYYYVKYTINASGTAYVSAGTTTSEYSKYNVRPIRNF